MIDDQVSKIRVRGENFVGNSSLGLVKKGNGIWKKWGLWVWGIWSICLIFPFFKELHIFYKGASRPFISWSLCFTNSITLPPPSICWKVFADVFLLQWKLCDVQVSQCNSVCILQRELRLEANRKSKRFFFWCYSTAPVAWKKVCTSHLVTASFPTNCL